MNFADYQILASRTEKPLDINWRLAHGALGLASELAELRESDCDYREECGDLLWYSALLANSRGLVLGCGEIPHIGFEALDIIEATISCIADLIKGKVIYGKSLDEDRLSSYLNVIVASVADIGYVSGFTLEECMEANIQKLRVRYPDAYKDEYAIARLDKK